MKVKRYSGSGRIHVADRRADIQSGGDGFDQQGRIDGRLKQRQLTHNALNVHAVADLEQPISHRVP